MRYLTLLLLTAFSLLFSADLTINELLVGNDLTAIQADIRDVNNKMCGVVRVYTAFTDLAFESSPSPMKVKVLEGETQVYLSEGTRMLKIIKKGFGKKEWIFPTSMEAGTVYKIELSTTGAKLEDITVNIITTPPGATVFIDGKDCGTAEQQKVSVGSHEIKLVKAGYATKSEKITVSADATLFKYKLNVQMDVPVSIKSTPSGATVNIDNIEIGKTPADFFYPAGSYKLKLSMRDYAEIEENIEIKEPQTEKSYQLEDNRGSLTIKTGSSSTVYLNDKAYTQGVNNLKLAPQMVRIKIVTPKADEISRSIVLKAKDNQVLELYPQIKTGTIAVSVLPVGSQVSLTGDGGESYGSTGTKVFEEVPVGTYQLSVKASGYPTHNESFRLTADEVVKKQIVLKQREVETVSQLLVQTQNNSYAAPDGFVFVKGGTFSMGSNESDDEKPIHSVTVSDFYIGKYEVTQKEWQAVMGSNPSNFKGDDLPVEQVRWDDVQDFIKKLNAKTGKKYRLPTEAEWEYAARGGNKSNGYIYSGSNDLGSVAWYGNNSGSKTHPVGTKQANELGIYDMTGNVWEWCSDWYDAKYYGSSPSTNPQGASTGSYRVNRGGGWYNNADYCRVAFRINYTPDYRFSSIGFRMVLTP